MVAPECACEGLGKKNTPMVKPWPKSPKIISGTIQGADYSIWFSGRISSNITKRSVTNPSVWKESASWNYPWPCVLRGDLSWNHCTSTPHQSETNGIAERAVRRVKEGTSAVLLQSGLNESWWADSMECYTYLRNVTDLLSDGKTPYERRFGQPFKGPIIPFGSLVEYHL